VPDPRRSTVQATPGIIVLIVLSLFGAIGIAIFDILWRP
jgi:hypothetical protein